MSKYEGKSSMVLAELLDYARTDLAQLKKKETADTDAISGKEADIEAVTNALLQACSSPPNSSKSMKDYEGYRIRAPLATAYARSLLSVDLDLRNFRNFWKN